MRACWYVPLIRLGAPLDNAHTIIPTETQMPLSLITLISLIGTRQKLIYVILKVFKD
jgi:hypothetical protein